MSIWTFLIILYKKDSIYDIISSLCEDKAALQPSAALPLVIIIRKQSLLIPRPVETNAHKFAFVSLTVVA